MKNLGPKILELKTLGLSYNEIVLKLGCSKGVVSYHLGDNQKNKTRKRWLTGVFINRVAQKIFDFTKSEKSSYKSITLNKLSQIINGKIKQFNRTNNKHMSFTSKQFIQKIGANPKCELTGRTINLVDTKSWHMDHRIPTSRGGDNSLENAAILCKEANQAKNNMTNEEFIDFCKEILNNNGYSVSKNN